MPGRVITLGDLFEGAGPAAGVMVGSGAPAGQSAVLDAEVVRRIAQEHGLEWSNPTGVRRIIVRSEGGGRQAAPSGPRMVDALTYARNIAAGETIQAADLVYGRVAAFAAPQDMPSDAEAIIGKAARRPLRAGAAVASRDVAAPQVIHRGDAVQVVYRDGGVSLTLQGQAVEAAALGDPVPVLNTATKAVIQAIAVGPDQAVIGPGAARFRQAGLSDPNRFAALR